MPLEAVRRRTPGTKDTLRLLRDGKPLSVEVVLGSFTLSEWVPRLIDEKDRGSLRWLADRAYGNERKE